MVRVAVAGGTGGIGRHIVEGILATKKHTIVVLSRSSSNSTLEALGVEVKPVDYTDHDSLAKALYGVHTVISAIWAADETLMTSQLALLNAAVETGVKRFVPSIWNISVFPDDPIVLYRPKSKVVEAVAKSGLEWTIFETGIFMNYFVSGTKGVGHLYPFKLVVDVEKGTACIPGMGDQKVYFTSAEDVGTYTAASLDLIKWPSRCGMVGEALTYNEVVALAEKIRGRKFEVTYKSEDELRKEMDMNPSQETEFFNSLSLEFARGRFVFEANLNALFPEVKPIGAEELMKKWWV